MHSLYEKFILEYFRYHHPEYKANPDTIPWNIDDGMIDFLPGMVTDITLKSAGKVLIIDAKYYGHTMQTQNDVNSIHSGNLYQIFAYVKNLDRNQTGNVAGMLLYAKTQEQITPNNKYSMDGNTIWVRTLDLNLPFPQIAEQLEKIAGDYLEAENLIELVSEQTEDAKESSNTAFSYHMRAVLLTWNIRIRGIKDDLWNDILPDMLVFFDLFIWRLGT